MVTLTTPAKKQAQNYMVEYITRNHSQDWNTFELTSTAEFRLADIFKTAQEFDKI
jgi:hypothetical protein